LVFRGFYYSLLNTKI